MISWIILVLFTTDSHIFELTHKVIQINIIYSLWFWLDFFLGALLDNLYAPLIFGVNYW